MKRVRPGCRVLLQAMACMLALATVPSQGRTSTVQADLGDPRPRVLRMLGSPLRAWHPSHCPNYRIELRRRGGLWLKLVYGPDDRVLAAGISRLAMPAHAGARKQRRVVLRWPGLAPGAIGRSAYPPAERWRPLLLSIGAKQWLWIEESTDASDPLGRSRYLGGVVVDDASDFAGGSDFPYDVAQATTATQWAGTDWAEAEMTQPLVAWRRRTPPNTYIEALDAGESSAPGCGSLTLALLDYTDVKP